MAAQRPENINEIILDTAEELLKVNSFSEVTLAKIAEKANISKGTLYYYYKSKNEILFAVTDRYLSRQWDELIQWTENKEKDTSPHRLVNYVIERNIAYAGLRLHLFDAALLGDEEIRAKLIHRYDEFQKLISAKIAERTDVVSADYFTWLILMGTHRGTAGAGSAGVSGPTRRARKLPLVSSSIGRGQERVTLL